MKKEITKELQKELDFITSRNARVIITKGWGEPSEAYAVYTLNGKTRRKKTWAYKIYDLRDLGLMVEDGWGAYVVA